MNFNRKGVITLFSARLQGRETRREYNMWHRLDILKFREIEKTQKEDELHAL